MDLSWYVSQPNRQFSHAQRFLRSWDGLTLYAASSDGTLGVFNFDPEELEGIAPHSAQEQYLQKFGFVPAPIPEGYSHQVPARDPSSQMTPPPSPTRSNSQIQPPSAVQSQTTGFGHINGGGERVNMLVAKRSNKKRVQPTQASSIPSAFTTTGNGPVSVSGSVSNGAPVSKRVPLVQVQDLNMHVPSQSSRTPSHSISPIVPAQSFFPSPSEQPFDAPDSWSRHADVDMDVPISSLDTASSSNAKGKKKVATIDLTDDARPSRPRTLGGDRPREPVAVREINPPTGLWDNPESMTLPVPPLLTYLSGEVEGTEDVFEGRNSENDGICASFRYVHWVAMI